MQDSTERHKFPGVGAGHPSRGEGGPEFQCGQIPVEPREGLNYDNFGAGFGRLFGRLAPWRRNGACKSYLLWTLRQFSRSGRSIRVIMPNVCAA